MFEMQHIRRNCMLKLRFRLLLQCRYLHLLPTWLPYLYVHNSNKMPNLLYWKIRRHKFRLPIMHKPLPRMYLGFWLVLRALHILHNSSLLCWWYKQLCSLHFSVCLVLGDWWNKMYGLHWYFLCRQFKCLLELCIPLRKL